MNSRSRRHDRPQSSLAWASGRSPFIGAVASSRRDPGPSAAGSRRDDWHRSSGRSRRRTAFTLLELVVSLAVSSMLLVGVGSSVFLALQASDVSLGSSSQIREAHNALLRIARDAEYAVAVQSSATTMTWTVPDITGDGQPETLVYVWETIADRPLRRTMNNGPAEVILATVYSVQTSYNVRTIAGENVYTSLDVTLQVSDNTKTRVHMGAPLLNRPEVPSS